MEANYEDWIRDAIEEFESTSDPYGETSGLFVGKLPDGRTVLVSYQTMAGSAHPVRHTEVLV